MNLGHGVPITDDEHSDQHLWWPDHTFVMKHHQNYSNQSLSKSVTTAPRFGTWGPIADDEHSDHHLWWPDHNFVMKHHQNYSNQSLSKSVTTAPRFGTWVPIADAITVTSLTLAITVTPHSPTIVTTHSPTIVTTHSPTTYTSHKNTKSPSLASLASGTNKFNYLSILFASIKL